MGVDDLAASIRRGEEVDVPELSPLPRRVPATRAAGRQREWTPVERYAVIGVVVLAALLLLVLVVVVL